MRRTILPAGIALVLLVAVVAGWWWWRSLHMTELERALTYTPHDAARMSWTDWSGVRRELHASLDADSSPGELGRFMDRAFDRDLSSSSALGQSATVLQQRFGFSPASVEWEMFSQSDQGAVIIMRMPDDTDFDTLGDDWERIGYTRPDTETGVWRGGVDLLPRVAANLTPELQYLALDPDDHLVLASDTAEYLGHAISVTTGDEDSISGDDAIAAVVSDSGTPLAAAVYTGDQACRELAMSEADATDRKQADELLARAGEVNPMTAFAMALQASGQVDVSMGFETSDQARTNADTRATLASGPAPGQGGTFDDRFRLGPVTADGDVVHMVLRPRQGQYVLSDLSNGPVLFATC